VDDPADPPVLRIGELSRRVGVSEHVLRAWERRYGLPQPARSAGGFRLYTETDARRVRQMRAHLARGLSAAEAARAALTHDAGPGSGPGHLPATARELAGALRQALDTFDEPAAQAVLDRLVSDLSVTTVLREIVLPYLAELGERWERGAASIAQEHFASNLIRGRLAGLARGWGNGRGPRAVLACPAGERHDLALMIFGIALNRAGWRIDYLGADTPVEELTRTVRARCPDLVVLAATRPQALEPLAAQLTVLARAAPLLLAGAGASPRMAAAVGAQLPAGDPVTAAAAIGSARVSPRRFTGAAAVP
jgi:MerR family transcriptional regulator, light-induced transcriptional regulator